MKVHFLTAFSPLPPLWSSVPTIQPKLDRATRDFQVMNSDGREVLLISLKKWLFWHRTRHRPDFILLSPGFPPVSGYSFFGRILLIYHFSNTDVLSWLYTEPYSSLNHSLSCIPNHSEDISLSLLFQARKLWRTFFPSSIFSTLNPTVTFSVSQFLSVHTAKALEVFNVFSLERSSSRTSFASPNCPLLLIVTFLKWKLAFLCLKPFTGFPLLGKKIQLLSTALRTLI